MNETSQPRLTRRFSGVSLSLCVPGFGLIRAGLPRRGFAWFAGLLFLSVISGLGLGLSAVPFVLSVLIFAIVIIAQIWMLYDSYRPGRMTWRLWLLFFGLLIPILWLPPAAWVARAFKVPTGAMEPTLFGPKPGPAADHVIADLFSYHFAAPKRGDIIVFNISQIPDIEFRGRNRNEVFFIKRLVGLPGERIRIADGKLYANGKLLSESDGIPPSTYVEPFKIPSSAKRDGQDYIVGPDEYFTLGDNSENSYDSRFWGCVPAASVCGKITLIYYPFSRAGRLPKP